MLAHVYGRKGLVSLIVVGTLLAACGGGSSGSTTSTPTTPSPQPAVTTTFSGTVAGTAGQSGTLTITVQTAVAAAAFRFPFVATLHAQAVTATGSLRLVGGSIIALTGTYDSAGKLVSLSGTGFTFVGTINGGVLSGTWTGPNNAAGSFSSLNSTNSTVTAYCGTFTSSSNEEGVWALQTSANGGVAGASQVRNIPEAFCPFTGQLTGSALTLTNCEGTKITGTVQGGTASGGGTASDGSTLTFTASTSACQ